MDGERQPRGRRGPTRECPGCAGHARAGGGFRIRAGDGAVTRCLACALRHPALLRRSLLVALIVGSALVAINHGDALLAGTWPPALLWKLPLTYAVPFVVATWGALANGRLPRR